MCRCERERRGFLIPKAFEIKKEGVFDSNPNARL
jgi:hypothetical protein